MIREWLSLAIESKTDEMVDQCEDHTEGLYQSLIVHLNAIKSTNSELAKLIHC
jgi:hypothetical protein